MKHLHYVLIHIIFKKQGIAWILQEPYSFTSNSKIGLKKEIGSYRNSFVPSFNWKITASYQSLLQIIWNITLVCSCYKHNWSKLVEILLFLNFDISYLFPK